MIRKFLIFSTLVLSFVISYSQKTFTVAEVNYMLSPNNSYVQPDTTSNAHYISGFITAPIVINEKSTFLAFKVDVSDKE